MGRKRSDRWKAARKMPPLHHSVCGQEYDIRNSEAAQWLLRQPDIMQIVFKSVKDHGEIVFDPLRKTWCGIDYED